MKQRFSFSLACAITLFLFSMALVAQDTLAENKRKILAGFFEEWSIYGASSNAIYRL